MKKFILILIAFIAISISASSQELRSVKAFDNVSLGLHVGVQTTAHKPFQIHYPVVGFSLNKDFSPKFGLSLDYSLGAVKYDDIEQLPDWAVDNIKSFGTIIMESRFNLTNILDGYRGEPRTLEVESVLGVGCGHTTDQSGDVKGLGLIKAGMNFNITNVGKASLITFSIKPSVLWDSSSCKIGTLNIELGVTFRFRTSNGTFYNFVKK